MADETSTKKDKKRVRGIPLKRISIIFTVIMVSVSFMLVVGLFFNVSNYRDLIQVSKEYISWEESAKEMMISSDYLTEQARSFVETGEREYMDNYFYEADNSQRRDNALAYIEKLFPESDAYNNLQYAMNESRELMLTEYKAMRLKGEAIGDNISTYPERVQTVHLSEEEQALSAEEKAGLARLILFDQRYASSKERIQRDTNTCIKELVGKLDERQGEAEYRLRFAMIYEIVLIVVFVVLSLFIALLASKNVFDPLIQSISHIERDEPLSVQGGYEIRMLAYAYNLMYDTNRRNRKSLMFKADHDALTGALNRRAFNKAQSAATDGLAALMLFDIDNFKQINDAYGHPMGDKVLVEVVKAMRESFRAEDHIFRIGGDEFVVVLRGIDKDSTEIIKRKVKTIGDELKALSQAGDFPPVVTLSVGVAFGNVTDTSLMEHADTALYESKAAGKSACTFYKDDGTQEAKHTGKGFTTLYK